MQIKISLSNIDFDSLDKYYKKNFKYLFELISVIFELISVIFKLIFVIFKLIFKLISNGFFIKSILYIYYECNSYDKVNWEIYIVIMIRNYMEKFII